jgi:hypothetical protein
MWGFDEVDVGSEGVEFIYEGGTGGEAHVDVELRTRFPGIGGTIDTYQAIAVAHRNEFSVAPGIGHEMFLRHTLIKKLEDYFFKKGLYKYAHVTRPLGSTDRAYTYEWAFGRDGFPWSYLSETGDLIDVRLDDWDSFGSIFHSSPMRVQIPTPAPRDPHIHNQAVFDTPISGTEGLVVAS